jgi:phosphatidate phosphatase APP1
MTSLQTSVKQNLNDVGYYIPIEDCRLTISAYNATTNSFSRASWTSTAATSSFVARAGAGLLKDMGKTVVSSLRTFRKVQLVVPNSTTFNVAGSNTIANEDYLTGYIEMGFTGNGAPTPVAHFGR